MLLKAMKLRAEELVYYVGLILIGFLIGNGLLACIIFFDETVGVFRIGSVMALGLGIMASPIIGSVYLMHLFRLEIGFGISRKSFFVYDVVVSIIWNAIMAVVILILNVVDGIILKTIYSNYPEEDKIILSEYMAWIVLAVIFLAIIRELVGVIILKYGVKGILVMWAVFMAVIVIPQRMEQYIDEHKTGMLVDLYHSIANRIVSMDMAGFGMIGVVFAVAGLGISWLLIRKQAVIM